MNTRREDTRRAEEGMSLGANDNQVPPQDNQVPSLEELAMGDQVSVASPPITAGDIWANFLTLNQAMNSQENAVIYEVQAMMAQMNRKVGPRVPQHANTMASHLRDFARMNPHMFYWLRSDEDP
ncbi:hypothetical protein EJD97_011539 [Solanum chilense]|uniref:Uncharacterized protein n=1 Tax=Solanum chilense TaxID=4083 RepID=A0A6N2CG33_SOLCI|nr:hypothetical protein EJD97_011539 [Solanum chilense]